MTIDAWIQLAIAIPVSCSFVAAIGAWIYHRSWRVITRRLNQVLLEVTPNGGDSNTVGDRILRLEAGIKALNASNASQSQVLANQNQSLARIEQVLAEQK